MRPRTQGDIYLGGRSGADVGLVLTSGKLLLYDLATPDQPAPLSQVSTGKLSLDLALAGSVALVARMGPGADLSLVDIRDPSSPSVTGGVSFPGPGRRVASWGGMAYVAGMTRIRVLLLAGDGGPVEVDEIATGGIVTAVQAHGGRLLVTSGGSLQLYDLRDGSGPALLADAPLADVGAAIAVHGNTVHVAELSLLSWLRCAIGLGCDRQGTVEVFRIDTDGLIQPADSYTADARSLPYLRWSGAWAYAIEGRDLVGLHAVGAD